MAEADLNGKLVIGRREAVALPEWGVRRVRAKVDTGARTSALHVEDVEDLDGDRVRFHVVLGRREDSRRVEVVAERVRTSVVRPSTGQAQARPVVRTLMRLGGLEKEIELSLVCRRGMQCRMLLGRTAMGDDVLVDPSRKYVASAPPKSLRARPRGEGERR